MLCIASLRVMMCVLSAGAPERCAAHWCRLRDGWALFIGSCCAQMQHMGKERKVVSSAVQSMRCMAALVPLSLVALFCSWSVCHQFDEKGCACVQVRTLVSADFDAALQQYDVLLSPVAPTPAYKIGEKVDDPLAMYAGDLMTVNLNLAGLPAVAINAGFVQDGEAKLPVGIQIMGAHLSEARLLEVAHKFELTCDAARTYPFQMS